MFESTRTYDAFYVNEAHGGMIAVARGLQWLANWGDPKREGVIYVPVKDQLVHSNLANVLQTAAPPLAKGQHVRLGPRLVRAATQRTFPPDRWSGGPVLAVWPDATMLEELHDHRGVEALCVVPWTLDEMKPWATAVRARDVVGPAATPAPASIADPVVAEAMKSLSSSVNLSTGLAHPRDKNAAVEAFRILKKGRHTWTADEIYAWALANGWRASGAAELRDVADGILAGRRYRSGSPTWAGDILAKWRERAKAEQPGDGT